MRIFQLQRYSAIALLVFLTIHMIVVHYPPFHIDFSRIIERMAQPVWKVIDIAFLVAVVVHALTGMYMVLTDIQAIHRYRRVLIWASVLVGLFAIYYGTITILAFQPPASVTGLLP